MIAFAGLDGWSATTTIKCKRPLPWVARYLVSTFFAGRAVIRAVGFGWLLSALA